MTIVTVPHASLRKIAQPVVVIDKKLHQLMEGLQTTLSKKDNPRGVGLAAPQVDRSWRVFALNVGPDDGPTPPAAIEILINPIITAHSKKLVFGPDPDEPTFEGCLSIPNLYGPVPRWEWVEIEYQQVKEDRLVTQQRREAWFEARVIQHEIDHLDGKLFTDYSLSYDLPVYREDSVSKKLVEITDRSVLELW
jgi:peptide deformylase